MDLQEFMPTAAITALFLAVLPCGRDIWMIADMVLSSVLGLGCVFVPETILRYQVDGVIDGIHLHIYRLFGLILLCNTLFAALTWRSDDGAAKTAVLWGRVIGTSIYVLSRINAVLYIQKGTRWNKHALYFGIYGDCLWFIGNLVYALRSSDWGGVPGSNTRLNFHLWLDFVQTFLFAFTFYVFPGHMLGFQSTEKLRGLHLSLVRMFASFIFNSAMIAGKSPNFTNVQDKYYHLLCRVVTNALILTAQMYTHYMTEFWTIWHIYFGMIGISVWSVNAALGYFNAQRMMIKED